MFVFRVPNINLFLNLSRAPRGAILTFYKTLFAVFKVFAFFPISKKKSLSPLEILQMQLEKFPPASNLSRENFPVTTKKKAKTETFTFGEENPISKFSCYLLIHS